MTFTPTEEQERILAYRPGRHVRILAGPGTGKSATVVKLVDDLLSQDEPPRVRLVTFTRAATAELAQKVSEHPAAATLRPSTVHSFALSVLLQNPDVGAFPRPLRLADDWEQKNIVIPTLGRRINVQPRRVKRLFQELASNWEALTERPHPNVDPQERARFMGAWLEHRAVFGYTLLGELPFELWTALLHHEDLRGVDFDVLVVDEYQDLNACDLEVLTLLAGRGAWIVAVGDDDQSIYSFRCAAPEGIRRFGTDYPEHLECPLSISHRCGRRIIDWALHIIEGDPDRDAHRPRLTAAEGSREGEVALLSFPSAIQEARGIVDIVEGLRADGVPLAEILILTRSDYQGAWSGPIKEELERRGIEYSDPDEVTREMDLPENRWSLALLRLLVDPTDSLAWATLLYLTTGVGDAFADRVYGHARTTGTGFGEALRDLHQGGFPGFARASANRVTALMDEIGEWLRENVLPGEEPGEGWSTWIRQRSVGSPRRRPTESLLALLDEVRLRVETDDPLTFDRFLSQLRPVARDLAQARSEGVRIMSMAASKGLTVQATILPGLEDGVLPKDGEDAAEERRLLYVAMTRAKRYLFGTWATNRTGPTARTGRTRVQLRRTPTNFLAGGPVDSENGRTFISRRWPR